MTEVGWDGQDAGWKLLSMAGQRKHIDAGKDCRLNVIEFVICPGHGRFHSKNKNKHGQNGDTLLGWGWIRLGKVTIPN